MGAMADELADDPVSQAVSSLTIGLPELRCLARTTLAFRLPPGYGSGAEQPRRSPVALGLLSAGAGALVGQAGDIAGPLFAVEAALG
jgi:hypothetical protein